ncbi:hypothetical protein PsYK624_163640 [Phanerochaete sordida]|uniref:BTB domain-containing protein n=1 Tax=Phanerochaete sordida TaxID=48140 RepID=A0A9P3GW20_9APHY|nr:hypothetical protein PsYK624_163640 [Phanerochaete sordida]
MSFKLHASILEKYPTVIEEMLDEEPLEMFEGCRILRVYDPGEELGSLFQVLYDGSVGDFFNWSKPMRFEYLQQVTLLAVEYEVQHIIDEAVARLQYVFPITFESSRLQQHSYTTKRADYPVQFSELGDVVDVVILARKINERNTPPFIVMARYYHCARLDTAGLYCPKDDDGVFLSYDDFLACVLAYEKLDWEGRFFCAGALGLAAGGWRSQFSWAV